jgi:hypothetical protein
MAEATSSRKRAAIPIALVAAAVVLVVWFVIANSSRRVQEVIATVEAITSRGGENGPERTAMIGLPDGRRLYARIVTREPVRPGQEARIVVTEQLLSSTRTYEVVDIVDGP